MAGLLLLAVAGPAGAGTRSVIEVYPGPHALARALAAAHPGDTLDIHEGVYREHVTVSASDLTLQAAGDGSVVVNARCRARDTIHVTADRVAIDGLTVKGATEGFGAFPSEIYFDGAASGSVTNTTVMDNCDAEYGVNLFDTGPGLVAHNVATGFSDAGVYIGGISSTGSGTLLALDNQAYGNHRGIIVEDSGGLIRLRDNDIHDNESAGVFVTNSDGVRIRHNTVTDNGSAGIELDPTSDSNRVIGNTASGHTFDLANDGGLGNCFRNNTYDTSRGPITC